MLTIEILDKYATDKGIYLNESKSQVGRSHAYIKTIIAEWKNILKKNIGVIYGIPTELESKMFPLAIELNKLHLFDSVANTKDTQPFETTFYQQPIKKYKEDYMNIIAVWSMVQISAYFNKRLGEIYENVNQNKTTVRRRVEVKETKGKGFVITSSMQEVEEPLFTLDTKYGGVKILITDVENNPIQYEDVKGKIFDFYTTRKHPFYVHDGFKYMNPKGQGTRPYFPNIINEALATKKQIDTIVLTEGAVKAEVAAKYGVFIIGLSSITTYADPSSTKTKKIIHKDIAKLIQVCKVKNVVVLHDGDCRDISENDLEFETDLTTRPFFFYHAAKNTAALLKKIEGLDHKLKVFYTSISSQSIKGNPKGIDDLYNSVSEKDKESVTRQLVGLKPNPKFFKTFQITSSVKLLLDWFCIKDADAFYTLHQNLISTKEFLFNGDRYKWSSDKDELKLLCPKYIEHLVWVGDDFYEKSQIPIPLKNGAISTQARLTKISKTTCTDLYGNKFIDYMRDLRYSGFCNIPSHFDYQRELITATGKFHNRYHPFIYKPVRGECQIILDFVKHIFGDSYELGLDYIQLLLTNPTQNLPVIILYSPENATGKSKFCEFLFELFKNNAVFINNDNLKSEFGLDIYADKLLAMCEETILERKSEAERIKAITTADAAVTINPKGMSHYQINTYVKMIFCTNQKRMIYANADDERYWIIRTHRPKQKDPQLKEKMVEQIPAFVDYLLNRQLHTHNIKPDRMWFPFHLIKTDVFRSVVEVNEHGDVRELKTQLEDYFISFPNEEKLMLSTNDIIDEFLKNKSRAWVNEILRDRMVIEKFMKDGKQAVQRSYILKMIPDQAGNYHEHKDKKKPQRLWVFHRKDFVHDEVIYEQESDLDQKAIDEIHKTKSA